GSVLSRGAGVGGAVTVHLPFDRGLRRGRPGLHREAASAVHRALASEPAQEGGVVATWDDVSRIANALPEVVEAERTWSVRNKKIAWERPLRRGDYEALGDSAPDGPILGVRTPDVGVKEALIA